MNMLTIDGMTIKQMKLVRDYKKDSNHKWWKITLTPYENYFENCKMLYLEFHAYGFNSTKNQRNEIYQEYFNDEIIYVGKSRDEVISKEVEMLKLFHDNLLKNIERNDNALISQQKQHKIKDKQFRSFFDIPEIKMLQRKEKIKKINNDD